MPVRNIKNRYGKSKVGQVPSLKLDRMVIYESGLERDWIYLMEYDPDIESFEEQPLTIEYTKLNKSYKYTPDFKIVKADGQHILVEVKASAFVNSKRNQPKMAAARQWCADRNWTYQVITEADIRGAGHRLENVKMLHRFARNTVSVDLRARVYGVLNMAGCLTLAGLATQLSPSESDVAQGAILTMLWHHELHTEMNAVRISNDSLIYLSRTKEVTK